MPVAFGDVSQLRGKGFPSADIVSRVGYDRGLFPQGLPPAHQSGQFYDMAKGLSYGFRGEDHALFAQDLDG